MTSRLPRALHRALPLAALLPLLGAATAPAAEYWLRAEAFTKTMPDGRAIQMWGYARDPDGLGPLGYGPAAVPGPELEVPPGEGLTVHLLNNGLPEAVSITIPGQFESGAGETVRVGGRLRAFTREVAAGDPAVDYVWPAIRPGTYLYQSGSHPALQVQMGLYGPMTSDFAVAPGKVAYGGDFAAVTGYDQDVVLVYGEIAPDLHDAVRDGQYGPGLGMTSTVEYKPKYFLVNGAPFSPGRSPVPLGAAGTVTLVRFLNAGLLSHYPVFNGGDFVIRALDGNPLPFPRTSYEVDLHAGKTVDAFLTVPAPGYYPVVDRAGALSSNGAPDGGMQFSFVVPDAAQHALVAAKSGSGAGRVVAVSQPAGIDCGVDCVEAVNAGTAVRLVALPDPGSAFMGWLGPAGCSGVGECVLTVDAPQMVTAEFRYLLRRALLVAPNGGEAFPEGSYATIRWGAPETAHHYTVDLSRNGGATWQRIDRGLVGTTYVWRVPSVLATQTACRIRLRAFRANGSLVATDVSNANFTILNIP